MGFMDRLLRRWIAPHQGVAVRRYEAARPSNLAGGFQVRSLSIHEALRNDLRGLIAHSRQQAENNDYVKQFLMLVRNNVVGAQGIRMQNEARHDSGELDQKANTIIEEAWRDWGNALNCSLDGRLSWKGLQKMVIEAVARDGSVLVRQYIGRDYGPHGYQQQLLEIDHLDIDLNHKEQNGVIIRMGVEMDTRGRALAYHLFKDHPGDLMPGTARSRIRVPADQILLIMRPERPGQLLGLPWAYTSLRRMNMTEGFEVASITAARAGAAKMGFKYSEVDADHAATLDDVEGRETTSTGHVIDRMEPGMIETLPPGVKYQAHDPAYPTGEFGPFMKTVLQGAAAGLGVSYASLSNDLTGANFSSLRAGLGPERDNWRDLQQWLIGEYQDRTCRGWLPLAMMTGKVSLPLTKLDKFMQPRWRPRGWAYVSPGEEATANQREMAAGIRSPQAIVAERGEDLETVFEEIAAAQKLAKSYGIAFNPQPPGHETGGQTPKKPAEGED